MARKGRRPVRFVTRRKIKEFAIESYETANGDQSKAKELFEARCTSYGMDPMTIATLIISIIRFWLWLKEKGFLSQVPRNEAFAWLDQDTGFGSACATISIGDESDA